ncbi:MAG: hypothetical protein K2I67_03100 [Malacoplasma sp.]|nr:hypothetical protein [Malacoplasma sp.]
MSNHSIIEKYYKVKGCATLCSLFSAFFLIVLVIAILAVCKVFLEKIDSSSIFGDAISDINNGLVYKDGDSLYSAYPSYVVEIIAFVIFGVTYCFWLYFSINLLIITRKIDKIANTFLFKHAVWNFFIFFVASGILLGTVTAILENTKKELHV